MQEKIPKENKIDFSSLMKQAGITSASSDQRS
jgi:hypothetical protein